MNEFKINYFFEEDGEDFNDLFYEGLENFILEKINLQFCNQGIFILYLRCICFTREGEQKCLIY